MGVTIFHKKDRDRIDGIAYSVAASMRAMDSMKRAAAKHEPEGVRAAAEATKGAAEAMAKMAEAVKNYHSDMIHHPAHYCYSKYEPKDVIREWGLNFNLGSAVKYIARAGRKDDILQELKKAKQFLEFEIEAIEKERAAEKEV